MPEMPKLAEWHIYGNEQQGKFVTRKPEEEPLYYLGGVTNDVATRINFPYFSFFKSSPLGKI